MPGIRKSEGPWLFNLGQNEIEIRIQLLEAAPYTTTVEIVQFTLNPEYNNFSSPRIRMRLYHDVEMAEVIGWDHHRHWLPIYTYPNRRMYLPDEKLAINRFLGDWLGHCLKLGVACDRICESIRRKQK